MAIRSKIGLLLRIAFVCAAMFQIVALSGQISMDRVEVLDSDTIKVRKNRFLAAGSGGLGVNILINRIDANLMNKEWAKVSPASWKANLLGGIQTDYDQFSTNWLNHPMHGSLYYNAARYGGYSPGVSFLFSMGGSLVWEYFGETDPPSEIDLFTTTIGGAHLGEITYRLSARLRNNFIEKAGGTLLNPMAKILGLFYHDDNFLCTTLTPTKIRSEFVLGSSYPQLFINQQPYDKSLYLGYSLKYGDIFGNKNKKYKPFDYFILKTWANLSYIDNHNFYFNLVSHGPILKKTISENAVLTLSHHYDYLSSPVYKIGSIALTTDIYFKSNILGLFDVIGALYTGIIEFGSSQSAIIDDLYNPKVEGFNRDYVYGRGFTFEGSLLIKNENLGSLRMNLNRWLIHTMHDVKGTDRLLLLIADYDLPPWNRFNLGFQLNLFFRNVLYNEYPKFEKDNGEYKDLKIYLKYRFE